MMKKTTTVNWEEPQAQRSYETVNKENPEFMATVSKIKGKGHLRSFPVPNEEKLLALLKTTADVIYTMSPDYKIITEIFGRKEPADPVSWETNWLEKYIPIDDREFVAQVIGECIREKRVFDLEHRTILEDGSICWFHSRSVPLLDDDGRIREWFGAASNINSCQRSATLLRESKRRHRLLFDEINLGFCIIEVCLDERGHPVDFRFLEVNKSFEQYTGTAHAAWCSVMGIVPDDLKAWFDIFEHIISTAKPSRFQEYNETLGRCFDVYAFPIGEPQQSWIGVLFRDITSQWETEKALLESESKYRTIFETAGQGIAYINLDGTFQTVNRCFAEMFGYRVDEVLTRMLMDFCFPEERYHILLKRADLKNKIALQGEFRCRHKNGSEVWVAFNATPVLNTRGEHIASMIICSDITARKKMDLKLENSEAKYRNLFETSNDGFWWTDSAGFITEANEGLASMLGYQASELIGRAWTDFIDGSFMNKRAQICQEQRSGKNSLYELKLKKKDGTVIWARMNGLPLHDNKGHFIGNLSALTDITKRKQAELKLRKKQQLKTYLLELSDKLRPLSNERSIRNAATALLLREMELSQAKFAEYTDDGAVIKVESHSEEGIKEIDKYRREDFSAFIDILSSGRDVIYNDLFKYTEVGGWQRSQLLSLNFCANITVPICRGEKLVASLSALQSTARLWTPDEVEKVRETAERTWIAVEKARAEEALRQSEERYRALIKYAPAVICELDLRKRRLVSVNEVVCEQTGYTQKELEHMDPLELLDTGEKGILESNLGKCLDYSKPDSSIDIGVITKDGRKLYYSFNFRQIKDEAGKPAKLTVIGHNITERKRMEKALRKSKEKLHEADKSKNNFLSMLSHELRNPLAVITAAVSLFQMSGDKRHTEDIKETIERQSNQLCKLVDDLLDLTRITENKFELRKENIDLKELLLNTARDRAIPFAEKGIEYLIEVPEETIFIFADPVRITQSVENLLHNALKFTPKGGDVLISLKRENSKAVIRVKDSGMGIDKELFPYLFKPFTQADISLDRQDNGGLGLGLSITRGIIELHEGSISVESEGVGKGSLFKIYLPVLTEISEMESAKSIGLIPGKAYKILVIEDNKEQGELLCSLLEVLSHEAFLAFDGREGIALARKIRPDIILCDIGLPGMNGFEIAKVIKSDEELKETCLISLTGYADKDSIKRAHDSGFDKHFAKPVDLEKLQQFFHNNAPSCGKH